MNSIINGSRLLAAALCGFAVAGCDAVRDVRSEPATPPPSSTGVLEGVASGLAPARAVVLDAGVTTVTGYPNRSAIFGALGVGSRLIDVPFTFPTVPIGTPYNFTVAENPFGKLCTITNPSGTAGGGGPSPVVTCVDDPNPQIVRYPIGGTVAPEVAALPEFTVTLTSNRDYGVESIRLNGATTFQFENRGLNPTLSNVASIATQQLFQWTITGTYRGEDGREYQCRVVTSSSNNTPSNTGTSSAVSRGDVTGSAPVGAAGISRHIRDCLFPIEANVKYSAPPNGTDQPMGAGGVTLGLRQLGDAVPPDVEPAVITEFTPGNTRAVLWNLPSFPGAAYDLVVTRHPEGQTCIVRVLNETVPGNTGGVGRDSASMGSVIWLSNPIVPTQFTPNDTNVANGISIRCRNTPTVENQLRGVFRNINRINYPDTDYLVRIRDRQFLSFFDDGTFLFGSHGNPTARNGLEYGFYDYDPVLGTLDFNVFLDASTQAGTSAHYADPSATGADVVTIGGLSNTLGYGTIPAEFLPNGHRTRLGRNAAGAVNGGVARATNVTVNTGNPASISMTFSGTPINTAVVPATGTSANPAPAPGAPGAPGEPEAGAVATTATLTFTEPAQRLGQMTGAWVSDDNRRFWVYDFDNATGFHAGVNGAINVQDGCFVFNNPEASSSFYTRRGGSTGCMTLTGVASGAARFLEHYEGGGGTSSPATFASIDFFAPSGNLTSAPPGFFGRFPGAQGAGDGRPPSPNMYTVIPGTPETLEVQRTVNGEPFQAPVIFRRSQVKLD